MNKILVVAPHPDDETLGCGGTILKHKDMGNEIFWLIITKANQKITSIKNIVNIQREYVKKVAQIYDFNNTYHLSFLTTELDRYPLGEIISEVNKVIQEVKPHVIYIPNRSDIHSDHQISFQATYNCIKNFKAPFIKKILMYETLSETEFAPAIQGQNFIPNAFVNISHYLEKKIEIMQLFTTEKMKEPYPRSPGSIEALARFRGSRIGVGFAEAFQLLYLTE
jgi:LmbE family N-acetylglucosaminyl deacetylase